MKFLKMKITRILAFVAACILTAFCTFGASKALISREKIYNGSYYIHEAGYYELMSELWAVSAIYLRNLDSNGSFTGSAELEKSTEKAMQQLGLMDYDGNITIDDNGLFDYYVYCGGRELSNTDKSFDELFGTDYSYSYENGIIHAVMPEDNMIWQEDFSWYSTNYGMYYYYLGGFSKKAAVAVFDYDTTDLNCYTDAYGVDIYYKTDGTTPLPFMEYSEYNDIGETTMEYAEENDSYVSEDELPSSGYLIYNSGNKQWVHIDNKKFVNIPGDCSQIKICIRPTEQVIAEYESIISERDRELKEFAESMINLVPAALAAVVLFVFFIAAGGYSIEQKKYVTGSFEKLFTELPLFIILAVVLCGGFLISTDVFYTLKEQKIYNQPMLLPIFYTAAFTLLIAIIFAMLNSVFIRMKCRCFIKGSLVYRFMAWIWRKIKAAYKKMMGRIISWKMLKNNLFMRSFFIRLAIAFIAGIAVVLLGIDWNVPAELIVICGLVILGGYIWFNLRDFKYLSGLEEQISDMNGGDYGKKEVPEGAVTYTMTEKLNNISDGIQAAVDRQIKSERMKIDLVTNVSHDLKTPLTSIISYINLLSAEELNPAASDYVKILEKKSERLRAIVSDLFDLAKATSRTDVQLEMIDAVILIGQVLGDMDDKISASGMEIRTNINAESAPVMAEGKKLYRVMQNLIDNALKYSLTGTRIWLSLDADGGEYVITLKNISAYEMKFTPDEITERFTRGDESRTSEGNGLGLSIAKSFTEACGGEFEIKIDGDLFIAEIRLPIAEK